MNFNELPGLSQTQMEEWYHQAVAPNSSRLREGAIAKLEPKFVSCDFQAGEAVMEYEALEWELNPQSMVHGGIIITGFDTSLGMLCHYYAYPNVLTTVSLSSTFVRPIRMGDTMVFHSKIKSFGRSLVTLEEKYSEKHRELLPPQQPHSRFSTIKSKQKSKQKKGIDL